jgi:hypothetical protein
MFNEGGGLGRFDCTMNLISRSIYGKSSYKDCSFRSDPLTNMATTGNSYF